MTRRKEEPVELIEAEKARTALYHLQQAEKTLLCAAREGRNTQVVESTLFSSMKMDKRNACIIAERLLFKRSYGEIGRRWHIDGQRTREICRHFARLLVMKATPILEDYTSSKTGFRILDELEKELGEEND
jgi:hypothetical protein